MSFNLSTMLVESTAAHPEATLLRAGENVWSFADVERDSAAVAGWLAHQRLPAGSRVALQLPNGPEFVSCYFGVLRAGLVAVPLNPLLRPAEVAYQLDDADVSVLVTGRGQLDDAFAARVSADRAEMLIVTVGDEPLPDAVVGVTGYRELAAAPPMDAVAPTSPLDTAVIVYTSGTTGSPKGAELTHFQLYMNCTVAGERVGIGRSDVQLGALPMFHVFGLSSVLNVSVRFGASVLLIPRFDPVRVLEEAARHQLTVFIGVPAMFIAVRQAAAAADEHLPSLRCGISGGAPMPGKALHEFEEQFPSAVLLEGYGSTESASVVTASRAGDGRRAGSIGKPVWGVEVRIVDDAGCELGPGRDNVGELHFRGHNVLKGYFRQPEKSAESIVDGWFHTGDLGYRDDDGFLYIVDRKKDLVIRGGYNVYPREIEEVIYTHPAVSEAAVIGEPDDRLGEEVVAFVALRDRATVTPEELRDFVKERVAAYKYPRRVHIVDELPKAPSGKILKRELETTVEAIS